MQLSVSVSAAASVSFLDSLLSSCAGGPLEISLAPTPAFTAGGAPRWDSLLSMRGRIRRLTEKGASTVLGLDWKCLGNHQLVPSSLKELLEVLPALRAEGLHGVSVSEPYLAEVLAPRLPVHLSWVMGISQLARLRHLDDIDAERVTLHPDVNRDETLLRAFAARLGPRAQLVLNSGCFHRCPLELPCRSMEFHALEDGAMRRRARELYRRECRGWLRREPWKYLTLPCIAPRDVSRYERMGYGRFLLLPVPGGAAANLRTLAAYVRREGSFRLAGRTLEMDGAQEPLFCGMQEECHVCGRCGDAYSAVRRQADG